MPGLCCLAPGHGTRALKLTPGSKQEAMGAKPLATLPEDLLGKQPVRKHRNPLGLGTNCAERFQAASCLYRVS